MKDAYKPMQTTRTVKIAGRMLDVDWFAALSASERGEIVYAVTSGDLEVIGKFARRFAVDFKPKRVARSEAPQERET